MPRLEDFSRIVASVYAAALSPDGWVTPLADIRHTIGAAAAGLLTADGDDRTIRSASLPDEARDSYGSYYRTIDYVLESVEKSRAGTVHDGRRLVALQSDSEFNNDWMRPYELDDGLFVRLTGDTLPTCFLVAAPQRSNPFATPERIELVEALVPHWCQALLIHDRLRGLDHRGADVAELIGAVRHAIFVIDCRGAIVHMNGAAARILDSRDGLRGRAGTIEACRPTTDRELKVAIGQSVAPDSRGCPRGATVTCPRPSGKWPYIVHLLPLGRESVPESGGRALLIVVDPDDKPCPTTTLMRNIFGMTRAEAEVAVRILNGEGLKPISEELSLSLATVKTHLQHVFDKTQTHRQAELVRLLLAVIP